MGKYTSSSILLGLTSREERNSSHGNLMHSIDPTFSFGIGTEGEVSHFMQDVWGPDFGNDGLAMQSPCESRTKPTMGRGTELK